MYKTDRVLRVGEFDDLMRAYHDEHCDNCKKVYDDTLNGIVINNSLYILLEFDLNVGVPDKAIVSPAKALAGWMKKHS